MRRYTYSMVLGSIIRPNGELFERKDNDFGGISRAITDELNVLLEYANHKWYCTLHYQRKQCSCGWDEVVKSLGIEAEEPA